MRAVLVDTGPLYATVDSQDSYHRLSLQERRRFETQGITTAISYATLQEAHRLVLRRLGTRFAHGFLEEVITSGMFIAPTADDYTNAAHRVLGYSDQDISIADGICAELCEHLGIPVWTYDHHFDVMRVPVWR